MAYVGMFEMLSVWQKQVAKLENGEITKKEYDQWRYNYPKFDTVQNRAKIPSRELSDGLISALKKYGEQ